MRRDWMPGNGCEVIEEQLRVSRSGGRGSDVVPGGRMNTKLRRAAFNVECVEIDEVESNCSIFEYVVLLSFVGDIVKSFSSFSPNVYNRNS